jgi:hypothetical protein
LTPVSTCLATIAAPPGPGCPVVDVPGIGKDRPGQPARLFAAFLRGLVEHRGDFRIAEQPRVHGGGDGEAVLFDNGGRGLDDGLGLFGSGAHGGISLNKY